MWLPSDTDSSGHDFCAGELRLLMRAVESGALNAPPGSAGETLGAGIRGVPHACAVL